MRILSLDDFIEGKIPRKEDFRLALQKFEQECILPFLGKEVLGSFAYGSVNRGDCNLASDIDYFIIISDEKHKDKIKIASEIAHETWHIGIETRVIHADHAKVGLHRIDDSFRQHLEFTVAKYGYRGVNPVDVLSKSTIPLRKGLVTSMGIYLMKLNNGYCKTFSSEAERLEFLRDILEKPWHAMRVAIQHRFGSVVSPNENFEDTKEQLMRIYQSLGYNSALISDIEEIKSASIEYIALLKARQKGIITKNKIKPLYNQTLERIEGCYKNSYHFIDANARIITGNN